MKKAASDSRKPTTAIAAGEAVGKSKPSTTTSKPSVNATNPRKAVKGVGDLYSPPCTRSQKDRFKKQLENVEDSMLENRKPSKQKPDADTGRSALKELVNAPRGKGAGSAAPKKAHACGQDRALAQLDSNAQGRIVATAPSKGPQGTKKVQEKAPSKAGNSVRSK
ncbi:uncharacterized protein LOC144100500 [Amblyomma americanum]